MFDVAPGVLIVVAQDEGRVLAWNAGAQATFGHSAADAVGQRLDDLIGAAGSFETEAEPRRHEDDGSLFSHEVVRRRKDGALIYVNLDWRPLPATSAWPARAAISVTEVTHFKLVRDARLIASRYSQLLEPTPDAIVIVNHTGRILLVNRQTERLFGYPREELLGRLIEMLVPERFRGSHPGHRQRYCGDPNLRPMGAGLELHGRCKDGSEFPVEISLSPLQTEVGTLISSSIRDISERRRVERALHDKNLELERANQAKDRFLATMSHELRTPLNAIIGFTGVLLMKLPGPLTAEQESQLGMVEASGKHLLSLINDLLDLAKIESGKVEVQLAPLVLQPLITEVAATLRPAARAKGLLLELELPDTDVLVWTDRRSLQQVLINLTNNAIKFTDQGQVRVRLEADPDDGSGTVRVSVIDTGIGIASEDRDRLFQAFSQLGTGPARHQVEGTGLGLYLCGRLAQLLGGRIDFDSRPGQGSCFSLLLPRQPAA